MPKPTYTDPWYGKAGFVYFIGAGEPLRAIKIGVTIATGFTRRLRHLQSSNHELLRVLGVIPFSVEAGGMRQADLRERELHKRFSQHQRFLQGWVDSEWFNPHPEIQEYVRAYARPCGEFNLVDSVAKAAPGLSVSA